MSILFQVIISGLLAGGIYALVSMGLTLVFGVMRVINFAHGEFLMLGMYAAVLLSLWLGIDPYVSAAIAAPAFFGFGVLVHRTIILPLVRRGAPHSSQALATLGLSAIIANGVLIMASGRSQIVTTSYTTSVLRAFDLTISVPRAFAFVAALLTAGALYLLLNKTFTGMAIRATAQDRQASELLGIPTIQMDGVTFGIATACVGIAGAIMVPFFYVHPSVGFGLGLVAYIVVVLGGMGSMLGAFVGGLLIGVVEALTGYFLDPGLKELVYLIMFVAVLIFLPWGLFGIPGSEKLGEGH